MTERPLVRITEVFRSSSNAILTDPAIGVVFGDSDPYIQLQTYDPWKLPTATNPLLNMLVRVQDHAERFFVEKDLMAGRGAEPLRKMDQFIRTIATAFPGNLPERSGYLDAESYGVAKQREEMNRLEINNVEQFVDSVATLLSPRQKKSFVMLVKNLEDFPRSLKSTLDAIILLKCESLRFLVLADRGSLEGLLSDQFLGERRKMRGDNISPDQYIDRRADTYLTKVFGN